MSDTLIRRDLIRLGAQLGIVGGVFGRLPEAFADTPPPGSASLPWLGFPRQDLKLVQEVVGTAHRNLARVKELIQTHRPLVNAWWDWGFGDWESPLGAASHVGQRPIAEYLLEQGARIDIFAAAMLGMTDVVKAFVTAQPGVQRTLGPHGITLLAHARAGGKKAEQTVAYLDSLGDADRGLKIASLPADRKGHYVGKFTSEKPAVQLTFRLNKSDQLVVALPTGKEESGQRIHYVGEDEFFPSGVPSVRFRFAVKDNKAVSVAVRGGELILTAKRVGD